jgi:hypothetical protein
VATVRSLEGPAVVAAEWEDLQEAAVAVWVARAVVAAESADLQAAVAWVDPVEVARAVADRAVACPR